jgi:hypothetical protein
MVLMREIMVTTGFDRQQSSIVLEWISEAARELPRFFVAAATTPIGSHSALVLVEKRPEDLDLAAYWAPENQRVPELLERFAYGHTTTAGGPNV